MAFPLFGVLSDCVSRKAVYVGACLFMLAFAWPYYEMVGSGDVAWLTVAVVVSLAVPWHAVVRMRPKGKLGDDGGDARCALRDLPG